ncbi:MAG: hypothetical protein GX061_01950 [Eubacteriaceae bacterium]|nr:hypothetical protein [Eubacteriaceae bacterium]
MKITLNALPDTLEEFKLLLKEDFSLPEYTCALLICAFNVFCKDNIVGTEAINLLKGPEKLSNHAIGLLKDCLNDKPHLPLSFFKGATPQNNYTPREYTIEFLPEQSSQACEEGYMRLWLSSGGADSPRQVKLRKKGDEWFIWEYPSLIMGIRKPAKEDVWA